MKHKNNSNGTTLKQVEDKINGREAELRSLTEDFNAKQRQFAQFQQQCQVRANVLEGMIMAHKEEREALLPKVKPKDKEEKAA